MNVKQVRGGDIGWAVEQMRNGELVCRPAWNGKGMYLGLCVPGSQDYVRRPDFPSEPFVWMKTVQGGTIPWLCSQADLLANDWEIAEQFPKEAIATTRSRKGRDHD